MDMELRPGPMDLTTLETSTKARSRDKEDTYLLMGRHMLEIGTITTCMARESANGQTAIFIQDLGETT